MRQERALQGPSAAVGTQAPGCGNDPVAGDNDRDRVLRADRADGARSPRMPRLLGNLRVRARLAVGDAGDGRQDVPTELGAFHEGFHIEVLEGAREVPLDLVRSIRYRRRLLLFHRRQVHAREVHARDPPLAVLRDADPSNQRQVRIYPGSAHES